MGSFPMVTNSYVQELSCSLRNYEVLLSLSLNSQGPSEEEDAIKLVLPIIYSVEWRVEGNFVARGKEDEGSHDEVME